MVNGDITIGEICELIRDRERVEIRLRYPETEKLTTFISNIAYDGEVRRIKENKDGIFDNLRKEIVRQIRTDYGYPITIYCGSQVIL